MFKVYGTLEVVKVATTAAELKGFEVTAQKHQPGLHLEAGEEKIRCGFCGQEHPTKLFFWAKFLGYDFPNGNGDAIPRRYAGDFGASFINRHLDVNHLTDPANVIGKIESTWHVETEIKASRDLPLSAENGGPNIGKLLSSYNIENPITGELQVEGICMIDRTTQLGDDIAKKLISGVLKSVSQEASTEYCQCSVCGHKMHNPFEPVCPHVVPGSLMIRSYEVEDPTMMAAAKAELGQALIAGDAAAQQAANEKMKAAKRNILAYKIHHNPVGTGLAVVTVPAYAKADVMQLIGDMKTGKTPAQQVAHVIAEQESIYGQQPHLLEAVKEINSFLGFHMNAAAEKALAKLNGVEAVQVLSAFKDIVSGASTPEFPVNDPTMKKPVIVPKKSPDAIDNAMTSLETVMPYGTETDCIASWQRVDVLFNLLGASNAAKSGLRSHYRGLDNLVLVAGAQGNEGAVEAAAAALQNLAGLSQRLRAQAQPFCDDLGIQAQEILGSVSPQAVKMAAAEVKATLGRENSSAMARLEAALKADRIQHDLFEHIVGRYARTYGEAWVTPEVYLIAGLEEDIQAVSKDRDDAFRAFKEAQAAWEAAGRPKGKQGDDVTMLWSKAHELMEKVIALEEQQGGAGKTVGTPGAVPPAAPAAKAKGEVIPFMEGQLKAAKLVPFDANKLKAGLNIKAMEDDEVAFGTILSNGGGADDFLRLKRQYGLKDGSLNDVDIAQALKAGEPPVGAPAEDFKADDVVYAKGIKGLTGIVVDVNPAEASARVAWQAEGKRLEPVAVKLTDITKSMLGKLKAALAVMAGGGAGIVFKDFKLADYGKGMLDLKTGKITWESLPTIESFSCLGYQDGMSSVRGDILKLTDIQFEADSIPDLIKEVQADLEHPSGAPVEISMYKLFADFIWQWGWIRSAPKAGTVLSLVQRNDPAEADFQVNDGYVDLTGVRIEAAIELTEDFTYFYGDVFESNYPDDAGLVEFFESNPERMEVDGEPFKGSAADYVAQMSENDKQDIVSLRSEDSNEDARMNWGANAKTGYGFRAMPVEDIHEDRTVSELKALIRKWEYKAKTATGEAKTKLESDIKKAAALIHKRQQEKVTARLFPTADRRAGYWLLEVNGKAAHRAHLADLCGKRFGQVIEVEGEKMPVIDHLMSNRYQADLLNAAVEKGAEAVIRELKFAAALTQKASGIKKLSNGKWRDTNGNSYDSAAAAADAEAHLFMDPKAEPETEEYRSEHRGHRQRLMEEAEAASHREANESEGFGEYPKRLSSGRWQDSNGNSYATRGEAARAEKAVMAYQNSLLLSLVPHEGGTADFLLNAAKTAVIAVAYDAQGKVTTRRVFALAGLSDSGLEPKVKAELLEALAEKARGKDLPNVLTCHEPGCNYQTNQKGDMTEHRKTRHGNVEILKTPETVNGPLGPTTQRWRGHGAPIGEVRSGLKAANEDPQTTSPLEAPKSAEAEPDISDNTGGPQGDVMPVAEKLAAEVGGEDVENIGEFRYSDKNDSAVFTVYTPEHNIPVRIMVSLFESGEVSCHPFQGEAPMGSDAHGTSEMDTFEGLGSLNYDDGSDQSIREMAADVQWWLEKVDGYAQSWDEGGEMEAGFHSAFRHLKLNSRKRAMKTADFADAMLSSMEAGLTRGTTAAKGYEEFRDRLVAEGYAQETATALTWRLKAQAVKPGDDLEAVWACLQVAEGLDKTVLNHICAMAKTAYGQDVLVETMEWAGIPKTLAVVAYLERCGVGFGQRFAGDLGYELKMMQLKAEDAVAEVQEPVAETKTITITEEVVTEESAEEGSYDEELSGSEEVLTFDPAGDEDPSGVQWAIKELKSQGAQYGAGSDDGRWFSSEAQQDFHTGNYISHSMGLHGFTPEEMQAIHDGVYGETAVVKSGLLQSYRLQAAIEKVKTSRDEALIEPVASVEAFFVRHKDGQLLAAKTVEEAKSIIQAMELAGETKPDVVSNFEILDARFHRVHAETADAEMETLFKSVPMLSDYLVCALWSSTESFGTEEGLATGGNNLDDEFGITDLSPEFIKESAEDCQEFWEQAKGLIGPDADMGQVGHDFWLTRNHHGAGFWDRPELYGDGSKANAEKISDIAQSFGEVEPVLKPEIYQSRDVPSAPEDILNKEIPEDIKHINSALNTVALAQQVCRETTEALFAQADDAMRQEVIAKGKPVSDLIVAALVEGFSRYANRFPVWAKSAMEKDVKDVMATLYMSMTALPQPVMGEVEMRLRALEATVNRINAGAYSGEGFEENTPTAALSQVMCQKCGEMTEMPAAQAEKMGRQGLTYWCPKCQATPPEGIGHQDDVPKPEVPVTAAAEEPGLGEPGSVVENAFQGEPPVPAVEQPVTKAKAEELATEIKEGIKAPHVSAQYSTLGNTSSRDVTSILFNVVLDPKEEWANGIIDNARLLQFHWSHDGKLEEFRGSRRLGLTFRKTMAKTAAEVVAKVNAYLDKVAKLAKPAVEGSADNERPWFPELKDKHTVVPETAEELLKKPMPKDVQEIKSRSGMVDTGGAVVDAALHAELSLEDVLESATDSQLASFVVTVEGDENGFVYGEGEEHNPDEAGADYYELCDAGKEALVDHILEKRELYESKLNELRQPEAPAQSQQ
jgi:hypothetical protein